MTRPPTIPYDPDRVARGAIVQFVGRCAIALLIVGIATFGVASKLSSRQALHDAQVRGETFARAIAAPQVTQGLRQDRPGAVRRFTALMNNRLKLGGIAHIKVWDPDGTIIWADKPELAGKTFPVPQKVAEQEDSSFTLSWTSTTEKSGDGDGLGEPNMLEVYVGTVGKDGKPVIVESYWSASAIDSRYQAFLSRLAPLSLGALLLLMVAIVPLGVSLARRLAKSTRERDRMLQHALRASDLERRRMTRTLHDGVIQDLAGLAYVLPTITPTEPRNAAEAELRSTLVEATELIKSDVRQLREILSDLYPPSLEKEGLDAALTELADWAGRHGIDVTVSTRGTQDLDPAYARLAYRVVREGLINVVSHSGAEHALVWVRVTPLSGIEIAVRDDGRPGKPRAADQESGHFGLRILRDVMTDLGGELTVKHAAAGGTELRASLPVTASEEVEHVLDDVLIPG
jgi:signal transduction histidine kinase